MALKRLQKELKDFTENPLPGVCAHPISGDMFHWHACIQGPTGTPYEGGLFAMDVKFPAEYPFKPPKIAFITKIYHPNIEVKQLKIDECDPLKDNWSPALTISKLLLSISSMMVEPNFDAVLVPEVAEVYKQDPDKFYQIAKDWTDQYAK